MAILAMESVTYSNAFNAVVLLGSLSAAYGILKAFYNIYLHPLSKYPGPRFAAATQIPIAYNSWNGNLSHWLLALHERYDSDVVRMSPDELSFISPSAWKDLYASRQSGTNPFAKSSLVLGGIQNILTANDADHARMRRLLSHAFSDKALREQEPLLQVHVNNLIDGLKRQCEGTGGKADLTDWLNWTTFDIIGDLAFGESFNCLKETTYRTWVRLLMDNLKAVVLTSVIMRFPPFDKLAAMLLPKEIAQARIDHYTMSREKVNRRLDNPTSRPDFISYITRHNGTKAGMSREEIQLNAGVFIVAGSETTATVLCGAIWELLHNPTQLARLQTEIRSTFSRADEIKLQRTDKLTLLSAVIMESFRIYPPGLAGQARDAPPSGDFVSGYWVPPKTRVHLNQYAAYLSQRNFSSPSTFAPSRWLRDTQYANDKLDVVQPYSVGARNCIGKNLANGEIALVLTRLLWEFDIALSEETDKNWADQKAWFTWDKKPLVVELKERESAHE
ncbi:MAG: hypothetical protein Q9216_002775 [Gyalolechia sp. 2 TL-2023]